MGYKMAAPFTRGVSNASKMEPHTTAQPMGKQKTFKFLSDIFNGDDEDNGPQESERMIAFYEGPIYRSYDRAARRVFTVVEGVFFQAFVTLVIVAASILVGIQTYENMARKAGKQLDTIDLVIAAIFTVECVLRLMSSGHIKRISKEDPPPTRDDIAEFGWIKDQEEGGWKSIDVNGCAPWKYFMSGWNMLDFIVVMFSWIPLGNTGSTVVLLRLLRLLRVLKLVRAISELQVILEGLSSGFSSIVYILLLIFLVFYVYAIVGVMLFRDNDRIHFRSLDIALLSMFRISTLEDWTDVMYINVYGCDEYGYDYPDGPNSRLCTKPKARGLLAVVYFVSLVVVVALIMLSLFIGVITTSMQEAAERLKEEKLAKRLKQQQALDQDMAEHGAGSQSLGGPGGDNEALRHAHMSREDIAREKNTEEVVDDMVSYMRLSKSFLDLKNERSKARTDQFEPDGASPLVRTWCNVAERTKYFVENPRAVSFMTLVIIVAAVLVGVGTEENLENDPTLELMDLVVLVIFTLEAVVKIFAEARKPQKYFTDRVQGRWNSFDFLVVVLCYTPGSGSMAPVLRLARLLRVLKLIQAVPQLQIIIKGLVQGLGSIFYITMLMLLVFYIFAIAAINLFRENDPWHFPNIETSLLTLFRVSTLEDWTDVMYINMFGCDKYQFNDRNLAFAPPAPPLPAGSPPGTEPKNMVDFIPNSVVINGTTVLTTTGEAYEALTGTNMTYERGCGYVTTSPDGSVKWNKPSDWTWVAAFFFVVFVVVSAVVMLSLFVAVVTTGMQDAADKVKADREVQRKVKQIQKWYKVDQQELIYYHKLFLAVERDDSGQLLKDDVRVVLQGLRRDWDPDEIVGIVKAYTDSTEQALQRWDFALAMLLLLHPEVWGPEEVRWVKFKPENENSVEYNDCYLTDGRSQDALEQEKWAVAVEQGFFGFKHDRTGTKEDVAQVDELERHVVLEEMFSSSPETMVRLSAIARLRAGAKCHKFRVEETEKGTYSKSTSRRMSSVRGAPAGSQENLGPGNSNRGGAGAGAARSNQVTPEPPKGPGFV